MLYFIIAAGLIFLVMFVAFRLIKDTVKVAIGAVSLVVLILITGSVMLYLDARELKENMSTSESIVLMINGEKEDTVALGGFSLALDNISEVEPFDKNRLEKVQEHLSNEAYDAIKGDSYKLIMMPEKAFDNILDDNIELLNNKSMKKQDFFRLLESDNATDYYINNVLSGMIISDNYDDEIKQKIKNNLKENIKYDDDIKFKSMIGSLVFTTIALEKTVPLIKEYKRGNVIFYPENIMLKLLKWIPDESIQNKLNLMKDKVKEKAINETRDRVGDIIS